MLVTYSISFISGQRNLFSWCIPSIALFIPVNTKFLFSYSASNKPILIFLLWIKYVYSKLNQIKGLQVFSVYETVLIHETQQTA